MEHLISLGWGLGVIAFTWASAIILRHAFAFISLPLWLEQSLVLGLSFCHGVIVMGSIFMCMSGQVRWRDRSYMELLRIWGTVEAVVLVVAASAVVLHLLLIRVPLDLWVHQMILMVSTICILHAVVWLYGSYAERKLQ